MVARLSALRADRLYPPRDIPGTRLCYRLRRSQDHSAAGRIRSMNKLKYPIANRTKDLLDSNAGSRPTAAPCTLRKILKNVSCRVKTSVDKLTNRTEVLTIKFKNSAARCSKRAIPPSKYERSLYLAFPWRVGLRFDRTRNFFASELLKNIHLPL
jgi:hypothetical protein